MCLVVFDSLRLMLSLGLLYLLVCLFTLYRVFGVGIRYFCGLWLVILLVTVCR